MTIRSRSVLMAVAENPGAWKRCQRAVGLAGTEALVAQLTAQLCVVTISSILVVLYRRCVQGDQYELFSRPVVPDLSALGCSR